MSGGILERPGGVLSDVVTSNRALETPRCNIGPAETARRRRIASALSVATVVLIALLVALHAPAWARLAIWPMATAVTVTWLQVVRRFCVRFGAMGVENFGPLGAEAPVDRAVRAADARRALMMILEGILVGLVVTLAILAIPA
jgi:hypothetical protein